MRETSTYGFGEYQKLNVSFLKRKKIVKNRSSLNQTRYFHVSETSTSNDHQRPPRGMTQKRKSQPPRYDRQLNGNAEKKRISTWIIVSEIRKHASRKV